MKHTQAGGSLSAGLLTNPDDGFSFNVYYAPHSAGRRGSMVLIHEIWGVTPAIKHVCDEFASAGYDVLAPHLFDRLEPGYSAPRSPENVDKALGYVSKTRWEDVLGDLRACVSALESPVFVVGFCFGGLAAWLAACRLDRLAAAACFYGPGIAAYAEETPRCPVILHYGAHDPHIPNEEWKAVQAAHPAVPLHVYEAGHGFFSNDHDKYDPDAAKVSRDRTLAFFERIAPGAAEAG